MSRTMVDGILFEYTRTLDTVEIHSPVHGKIRWEWATEGGEGEEYPSPDGYPAESVWDSTEEFPLPPGKDRTERNVNFFIAVVGQSIYIDEWSRAFVVGGATIDQMDTH
jgi:hypothetical protein